MLKRLAMLGLLVAAAAPMPGWATTPASNSGGNADNQGQTANNNPAPSAPLVKPVTTPAQAKPTDVPTGDNAEHSVKLTSLPPVTLIDKNKTVWDYFFDWGPWAFGLVLAIAGVWQLKLLRVTWKTIQAQKAEMATQTAILRDSVAVAQKAADAAEVSAKAAMGVAVPTLVFVSLEFAEQEDSLAIKLQYPVMRVVVKNYGQTPAILKSYEVKYSCEGILSPNSTPSAYHFEASDVIEPGQEYVLEDAAYARWQPFSAEDIVLILNKKKIFSVAGCLRYGNVFDSSTRELPFCKELADFRPGGADRLWVECNQGEKYRVSTEEQQHPNPN